jgi:hypothetical protein
VIAVITGIVSWTVIAMIAVILAIIVIMAITVQNPETPKLSPAQSRHRSVKQLILFLAFAFCNASLSAQPAAVQQTDSFTVPFEVHANLIFVKAMLNDKEEYFVFDSGAPMLVLNSDHFDTKEIIKATVDAEGVGGKTEVGMYHLKSFNWYGIEKKFEDVVTMSLGHLEKSAKHEFAGFIGFALFEDYQITFDYKRKLLTFLGTDFDGNVRNNKMEDSSNYVQVPFSMKGHIPVFTATINNKNYTMGLDCGAGSNLLYAKYIPELEENISKLKTRSLKGVADNSSKIKAAKVDKTLVGGLAYEHMNYAFEDATLSQISEGYGLNIDGLLGYEFLKERKTVVNYRKGKMFIEKSEK